MRFLTDPGATRIVHGAGSVALIPQLLPPGINNALIVTDPGVLGAGHVATVSGALRSAGVTVAVFDRVIENPDTDVVQACVECLRGANARAVVAVGGGSAIDTAKAGALLLANGGTLADFWHTGRLGSPIAPLIAVPTTAGTGSEVQSHAIISDPVTHRKMAIGTPTLLPLAAVLDPDLTESMPPRTAAMTGIDALSHAVEAAVSTRTTDAGRLYAKEAFDLICPVLAEAVSGSASVASRHAMLLGSAAAGRAIESGMLGAAHALANPLTARFGVAHGHAVGIFLPHVVRYNAADPSVAELYRRLDDSGRIADLASSVLEAAGLPATLNALGVDEATLPALAQMASEQWTASFNPRVVGRDELLALYRAAYGGN